MNDSLGSRTTKPDDAAETGRGVGFARENRLLVDRRKPERRALFLADVSRSLFESIDDEETVRTVAYRAMSELGAWCVIDLLGAEGEVKRIGVYHPNPEMQTVARELESHYAPHPNDVFGLPRISGTQQPELVSELSNELLAATTRDKRHLGILQTLGFCSYMVVPLKARGRLLGALTFVAVDTNVRFTPRDLLFAEDLSGRIAMAMDNARLYREAQEAREEAMAAMERAAIADRAKTDFLATMSHELRTPLNAIAGYAELLELGMRGPVTSQQREAIARIRRSEEHLLGIVNDILMFAKSESGRLPLRLEDTPLNEVLERLGFLVEPMLTRCDLTLVTDSCDPTFSVVADRDRLNQILLNLLSNAAKFSEKGGEITVKCEARGSLVNIHVMDKGCGIEADKLEEIFEPFVQLSSGLTRTVEGSGLGLAISRELARLMGGDVTVESELKKGSTFTLSLPMSPAPSAVMQGNTAE
jgi:signal transduction histidine kinase